MAPTAPSLQYPRAARATGGYGSSTHGTAHPKAMPSPGPSASTRPSSCHQATRLPRRPTPGRFNGVHLGTGPRRAGSRTVAAAASADQQYELPAHVTVLADAVRLRDLGEREGLRDQEREAPRLDQL